MHKKGLLFAALVIVVIALAYTAKKKGWGPWKPKPTPMPIVTLMRAPPQKARAKFMPDVYNWPTVDQMGATASTYPYGNYAGHVDMYYPSF